MADVVLEAGLEKLTSLIGEHVGLILGCDQEMKRLASLVTTIKATLHDAQEREFSMEATKDWLGKLEDSAHKLDGIMDQCYLVKVQSSSCLSSLHPRHVIFRYKTARKIKNMRVTLEDIAQERSKYHLIEMVPANTSKSVIEWRETTSLVTRQQVYGREEEKECFLDILVPNYASHSVDLSVFPFLGLPGVGKTEFVRLIYNHERVLKHFQLQIWVYVSHDFSLKRITKAIIQAASGHACADMDLHSLQQILKGLIHNQRYLLVLDDVCHFDQDNWEILKSVLSHGAHGASILVTTQLHTVAEVMGTIMPPHQLSLLSNDDCWQLFKHRAFRPNEFQPENLVLIGKEIVEIKCGGLPLAAEALGGLLRMERDEDVWLNVKKSNPWTLNPNIMPAMKLIYSNMPRKLVQCFACCAIFPKDQRILMQDLMDRWMAKGFIPSKEKLDAKAVGYRVWKELYWRSFFQDIEKDQFGKVTSFKMHCVARDLAEFVAKEICCITEENI